MDVEIVGPQESAPAQFDHWAQGRMWGGTITPIGEAAWWPAPGDMVKIRLTGGQEADAMVSSEGPKGPPSLTVAGAGAPPPDLTST